MPGPDGVRIPQRSGLAFTAWRFVKFVPWWLIARHVAKAKRARELSEPVCASEPGVNAEPHSGSLREILEARIRDPQTSARDLAALTNTVAA